MLYRITVARRKQRAFFADAAHELRSPLASMRTQLEVAERLGEGGELPSELLADVDRARRLVEASCEYLEKAAKEHKASSQPSES